MMSSNHIKEQYLVIKQEVTVQRDTMGFDINRYQYPKLAVGPFYDIVNIRPDKLASMLSIFPGRSGPILGKV